MSDATPHELRWDPYIRTISLQLDETRQLTVDVSESVNFLRMGDDEAEQQALWLSAGQADILQKMIHHILSNVKISEGAQTTLESLLPDVEAIAGSGEA